MFSGVAGLKTHQTKMDVIGNNIANVNTTAYKSSSMTFSELLYQNVRNASGPNATTGRAGVNARQIGLGVQSSAISNSITTGGATQTTGNPFDLKINGEAFFIVNDGKSNYFTRDGSFTVDAAGNLAMSSNGYNVMGWGVDQETQTIKKDTVSALRILNAANMTYPPEATTEGYVDGILDRNEPDATTAAGKTLTLNFFDALGYSYTAKFAIRNTDTKGEYTVELDDILDSEGNSLVDVYGVTTIKDIANFGGSSVSTSTELKQLVTGVKYTPANGTNPALYTKELGNEEVFSNYDQKALSGITYAPTVTDDTTTPPTTSIADGTAFNKGDTVPSMTGKGTISKKDMEAIYGMIYVTEDANGVALAQPYYHFKPEGATDPVKIYATDGTPNATTAADWNTYLGKTGISSATIDKDGNVTFEHTVTDFTYGSTGVYKDGAFTVEISQEDAYGLDTTNPNKTYSFDVAEDGQAQVTTNTTYNGFILKFDVDTGLFTSIDNKDSVTLDFNASATTKGGQRVSLEAFSDINIDWTNVTWYNNGGASTITGTAGTEKDGLGSGRKVGQMSGVTIQNNGEIYTVYDNGMTKLVGQIAAAKFANAAGLEKVGENLYGTTLNSGEFDGVGVDVTADGKGSFTTGALEMSNVDLSTEFTEMITTQRGFQANSRIITVSDTLLEELVNLKR